jgi:CBS domain containing-hemolysin-like protein
LSWPIIAVKLMVVGFLVVLNGFFVAAEFALVKIRDTQLEPHIKEGHGGAIVARKIIHNLDAALSACQLGITLASLGLGWVGEPVFSDILTPVYNAFNVAEGLRHNISFVVGFSIITFLHIVVGELAPKSWAIQQPLTVSMLASRPLALFHRISFPFIWMLNAAAQWILRRFGIEPASEGEHVHTPDELRLLVTSSRRHSGGGTDLGHSIVLNAMDLQLRRVKDIMRPRHEIEVLDTKASIAECLDVAEKTRFSRFPICEHGDIEHTRGVVHFKDLVAMRMRARTGEDLLPTARKVIYVPPTARLETLLQRLLERKSHMALVVDEYGGVLGLVTLENILEELVGQIQDEFDQEKPLVQALTDGLWEVHGSLPLHELAELAGEPIDEPNIVTASGLMIQRLGGFPKDGDTVKLDRATLTVLETDGKTISRLTVSRPKEEPPEGSHDTEHIASGAD